MFYLNFENRLFEHNLLFIVGNYGSGKTEVAVNLAMALRMWGREVAIADLDVVNPYFRCREPRELMSAAGIRVVVPPGAQQFADLPIIVPEIKGLVEQEPGSPVTAVFDVGGDDVGATVLASFNDALGDRSYGLCQVINTRRPFTDTVEGCLAMKRAIEKSAKLRVTGLIANTHLMEETSVEIVLEGYELTREVSREAGLPIDFVAVEEHLSNTEEIEEISDPVLPIRRLMLPPWLQAQSKDDSASIVGTQTEADSGGVKRVPWT